MMMSDKQRAQRLHTLQRGLSLYAIRNRRSRRADSTTSL